MSRRSREPKRHPRLDFSDEPTLFDDIDMISNPVVDTPRGHDDFELQFSSESTVADDKPISSNAIFENSEEINVVGNRSSTIYFISFGSGSSGNCAYIGTQSQGILIDAGIDPGTIEYEMSRNGLSMENVRGVLLTHDHSDHSHYIYSYLRRRRGVFLYCTPRVLQGVLRRHNISRRLKDYHRPIYKEIDFKIADFNILAFDVSHDGTDNCGFFIVKDNVKICIATDLGSITDRVDNYMRQANHIVIEANYDNEMLRIGQYPEHLKARIRSASGHMDNRETGNYLTSVLADGHHVKNIFLCHLSQDNNTPEIALSTVTECITDNLDITVGKSDGSEYSRRCTIQACVLPRHESSPLFILE